MITNQQLQDSLRLQEKVSAGNLTGAQASEVLRQATARRVPIDIVPSERNTKDDEIARANEVDNRGAPSSVSAFLVPSLFMLLRF